VTLYRAGGFTSNDVPLVAGVLTWWALGLFFFAAYMFVLKSFYSLQDTKTPMYTNIVATVVHVALYAALTQGVGSWAGLGIVGIPIADGVFFFGHVGVLLFILHRRVGTIEAGPLAFTLAKVVAASVGGAAVAMLALQLTDVLAGLPGGFLIQLAIAGVAGVATAYGAMTALRVPELAESVGRIGARFGKTGRRP
jgi:putative peptidoglycan lipid II flippase